MTLPRLVALTSVRAAVASPLGFLIGLSLGTLGGGGSILAVPALVYGAGQSARSATTTSLLVVGTTALAGMVGHLRAGRVRIGAGLVFGLAGIGGSFAGSVLNHAVPSHVLLLAFAGLMALAAWRMHGRHDETPCHCAEQLRNVERRSRPPSVASPRAGEDPPPGVGETQPQRSAALERALRVVGTGTAVGFLTGFFGVGGGFVIVPGLVLALGFDMPVAVGTSLLVIAVNSAEALAFRLPSSHIEWSVALAFTFAGLIGVVLGDLVAGRVPAARLTTWFVWLLVGVAAYTAAQSAVAL